MKQDIVEGEVNKINLIYRIKRIKYEIKYALQRVSKCYDDRAIWNIDSDFIDRYTELLTVMRNNLHSHPGTITEDEWKEILDKMIYHITRMSEY